MKYDKPALAIMQQIEKLKKRGLTIKDENKAAHYLSNISYYRLRAYTYPFQDNLKEDQPFNKNVNFDEIINLYVFDRQLRLLLFNAIEKIEISFRTQIIYQYALLYGSHWHLNASLYSNMGRFADDIATLQKEINRSKETFIEHYKKKYTSPKEPAAWMSLEVSSIGLLSKLFANLKNNNCKDSVTKHFGIKDVNILENWMRCFSLLRNICAHHGRVWNRRITNITLPKKPLNSYIANREVYTYKIYSYIMNIQYVLNIISPGNDFKKQLLELMKKCSLLQEKEMGFPKEWQNETFWK